MGTWRTAARELPAGRKVRCVWTGPRTALCCGATESFAQSPADGSQRHFSVSVAAYSDTVCLRNVLVPDWACGRSSSLRSGQLWSRFRPRFCRQRAVLQQCPGCWNESDGSDACLETRSYYDGAAFVGLSLGQLGSYGALSRSEQLVLDEARLTAAFGTSIPPFLTGGTKPASWPQAYWDAVSANSGYQKESTRYYAQTSRAQYDFQDAAVTSPRGLLQKSRTRRAGHRGPVRHHLRAVSGSAYRSGRSCDDRSARRSFSATEADHRSKRKRLLSRVHSAGTSVDALCQREDLFGGRSDFPSEQYAYQFSAIPVSVSASKRQYHDSDTDPVIPSGHLDDVIVSKSFLMASGASCRSERKQSLWFTVHSHSEPESSIPM